ncbi:unnamed protein product, partial [Sphacelaria rigidula]
MSESLFRRLCEAHPQSLQRLSYQYRMNGDVMTLCNDLTYSGRLRCGNARVEGQRLRLPRETAAIPPPSFPPALARNASGGQSALPSSWQGRTPPEQVVPRRRQSDNGCSNNTITDRDFPTTDVRNNHTPWLSEVLDPERRVIFLDTDDISPAENDRVSAEIGRSNDVSSGGLGKRPFAGLELRSA